MFGAIALHVKIAMRTVLFPPSFRTFSARASSVAKTRCAADYLRIAARELLHERERSVRVHRNRCKDAAF
ncbi:MAG TPA: hypothetical protein VLI21_04180, partial [Casimicrobiaceae bacterium]|nr:hypothetical protein [Casimicrobiaceae bacterium]